MFYFLLIFHVVFFNQKNGILYFIYHKLTQCYLNYISITWRKRKPNHKIEAFIYQPNSWIVPGVTAYSQFECVKWNFEWLWDHSGSDLVFRPLIRVIITLLSSTLHLSGLWNLGLCSWSLLLLPVRKRVYLCI